MTVCSCESTNMVSAPAAVASLSSRMVPPVTVCGHALAQARDTTLGASFLGPEAERCKL